MMRIAAVSLASCLAACGTVYPASGRQAEPNTASHSSPPSSHGGDARSSATADSTPLFAAFIRRLTVWTRRDGRAVLARHCREMRVDCRSRLRVFAAMMHEVAKRHGLDPFLLGALAFHESGLNPGAVGPLGTAGLIQLHPRGVGRNSRFVLDEDFRDACLDQVDACQRPVLETGAAAIAASIHECGNLRRALGRYATGRCSARGRYIGRVLTERERLRSLAGSGELP